MNPGREEGAESMWPYIERGGLLRRELSQLGQLATDCRLFVLEGDEDRPLQI